MPTLSEIQTDVEGLRETILASGGSTFDAKAQMTENVLPMFLQLIEALNEHAITPIAELREDVDDIIDQTADTLQPETAEKLLSFIQLTDVLAAELVKALPKLDDLTKKKIRTQLIPGYRAAAKFCQDLIAEITMPLDEEPDDAQVGPAEDAGDGDAGDDGGDDEGDDLAAEGEE